MLLPEFRLERYFSRHEFAARYLLSCSDCEPLKMRALLKKADPQTKSLWKELVLGYTETAGHKLLRAEIASLYRGLNSENVLTVVPEEGIFIAVNCLLEKSDHLIVPFPAYQSLYELAAAAGCEVSFWKPEAAGNWLFHIEDLFRMIKKNTRLIVLNFPHNPTGAMISREQLLEIISFAGKKRIAIFSDEMYRFLEYDSQERLPAVAEIYDYGVSLGGLSKSFGLAGLRCGWLITKNRNFRERFAGFKDYTTICQVAPAEILAVIALRSKEEIIGNNLTIIRKNLAQLEDFMKREEKYFQWIKPKAGPIAFCNLKADASASAISEALMAAKGVLLLPAEVYNFKDSFIRFGFGRQNFPAGLKELENFLSNNFFF